ncbi:MAG: hypothetical protein O3B70_09525 [Bacteroidetes bacterium]|nr:hypothetical protein [Bacteroidota bacterium]MDA0904562.1 hypothetical protein [Bacteroidota bacterium]MDA1242640.1 hypothetical protein [Bacteroidota bacterium]
MIMFTFSDTNHAQAQYDLDYGFAFGTGHFLGDVGGKSTIRQDGASDLHLSESRFSSHVFVRYRVNNYLTLRGQLGTVAVADDDANSTYLPRVTRNAHFRNSINELSARAEVHFLTLPNLTGRTGKFRMGLQAYGLAGVTGFSHAPQAQLDQNAAEYHFARGHISSNPNYFDYDRWYDLRSMNTEPGDYSIVALAIPFGLGTMITFNNDIRLGVEFVWNLTTTDYLDDVSHTWNNPAYLSDIALVLSSPSSAELLIQSEGDAPRDEAGANAFLDGSFYYHDGPGSPRGNPDKNDTYGSLQVTVAKVVKSRSSYSQATFTSYKWNKRRPKSRRPNFTRAKY